MPIDGIVVRNIVHELENKLTGGKIDKISQPEKDEVIMTIRNSGNNYKLLLSSSPSYPRVHLTSANKVSPINAPLFSMVLRKHLSGGRIVKFEQVNLDRIIKVCVESYDELGSLAHKTLICEIMGRHSNIILTNDEGIIVDSIKHITPDMSRFRQVLPGITYKYPPIQDKLSPLNFSGEDFFNRIAVASQGMKLDKFISSTFDGISTFGAREICHMAGLEDDIPIGSLDDEKKERLFKALLSFVENIENNNFCPCIYYNNDESPFDFYSFNLRYLAPMKLEGKSSISEAIEYFYSSRDKQDRVRQKSSDLLKVINNNLDRCLKKLAIQEQKLLECSEKEKWKLYGDLIMANLYNIKKGDSKAKVLNFYSEDEEYIEIPLDMLLTPVENANRYYKKYNKDKTAEAVLRVQKEDNLKEIEYLENQLVNISNCTEPQEIEEIRDELIMTQYIKKTKKSSSRKLKPSKPMHFISSDGFDIYVGKNNLQNDYLTTKFADSEDIWMHTKNIPGSHVIIKLQNRPPSENAILEAANLAAYYSKGRNSSNVPVDYTEKKNVKKPSGAKPGMVIYHTNKTIYVTPDEEAVNRMKS